eukprot:scaffold156751_cov55-Attheya_sp.AAC.1
MTPKKEEEPEMAELKSDERPSYRQSSFPEKLISILDDQDKYGEIITWVPDGKIFVVRSPERLVEEVLPNYFDRHCSFGSFVRKLYYWGFKKTGMNATSQSIGDNEIGFFHAKFCRGSPPSCCHLRSIQKAVRRSKSKKSIDQPIAIPPPMYSSAFPGSYHPLLSESSPGVTGPGTVDPSAFCGQGGNNMTMMSNSAVTQHQQNMNYYQQQQQHQHQLLQQQLYHHQQNLKQLQQEQSDQIHH